MARKSPDANGFTSLPSPAQKDLQRWHMLPLGTPISELPRAAASPAVVLRRTPGRGRGLFVSQAVECGELLLVCRAFAVGARGPALCAAATQAIGRLGATEPRRFCALHGSPASGNAAADDLSWWTCPSHSSSDPATTSVSEDVVEEIVKQNSMRLVAIHAYSGTREDALSGIFLLGSMANHACVPSTTRCFLGDALWVRAARRLEAGEEITLCYSKLAFNLTERRECLSGYGFDCACVRCCLESLAPALGPSSEGFTSAVASVEAAQAEREVLASRGPHVEELLAEAGRVGLSIRGLYLAQRFDELAAALPTLSAGSADALTTAALLEEAVAAVLPRSPLHTWCCTTLLIAAAAAAHSDSSTAATLVAAMVAARCLQVHESCFGGGEVLWRHRLEGSPASGQAQLVMLPSPITVAAPRLPWACPRLSRDAAGGPASLTLSLALPQATAPPAVELQGNSIRARARELELLAAELDASWVDADSVTGSWVRRQRRLVLRLSLRSRKR